MRPMAMVVVDQRGAGRPARGRVPHPSAAERAARGKAARSNAPRSIAIAAYLGRGTAFDRAIATFAEAYADQNERDHAAMQEAARDGRIAAERGV